MSSETIKKWRPPEEEVIKYKINVSTKYLELTKRKLELTRLPREVSTSISQPWRLGTPKSALEPLLDTWLESYSWREQEMMINDALPQFRTTIPTGDPRMEDTHPLRLHFVHKQSPAPDAIPLLYIHGYVGSFVEVMKILDPLTSTIPTHLQSSSPAFHVVAPSIPGFGFSDAPKSDIFGARETARCFDGLMKRLGYKQYVVECSGQGWKVARWLVRGMNGCVAVHTSLDGIEELEYDAPKVAKSEKKAGWPSFKKSKSAPSTHVIKDNRPVTAIRSGRSTATKLQHLPQTIAHGICDSPAGLLAASLNQLYDLGNLHLWSQIETLNWTMLQWLPGPEAPLRWAWATEQETFEYSEHEYRVRLGVTIYQQDSDRDDDKKNSSGATSDHVKPANLKEDGAKIPIIWSRFLPGIPGIPALDAPLDVVVDLREFCAAGRRDGWLLIFNNKKATVDGTHHEYGNGRQTTEDTKRRILRRMEAGDDERQEEEHHQEQGEEEEVSRESHWRLIWRWIKTNLRLRRGKQHGL